MGGNALAPVGDGDVDAVADAPGADSDIEGLATAKFAVFQGVVYEFASAWPMSSRLPRILIGAPVSMTRRTPFSSASGS